MAWIRWIDEGDADGELAAIYERLAGEDGVDHILKIHSLNPKSLWLHYDYYAHLMRGPSNLSRADREMIAVVVSRVNDCFY
ncbi:MAG: carboxymuconolactone decarboxylase family protein [Gemmatimonadota bacterium]|nr:MAG: carboxymuconolactone decarboxylase family protein [Gemmatimonadota bacterium]